MSDTTADVCQGFFMLLALVAVVVGVSQCSISKNTCQSDCLKSSRAAGECRWGCS